MASSMLELNYDVILVASDGGWSSRRIRLPFMRAAPDGCPKQEPNVWEIPADHIKAQYLRIIALLFLGLIAASLMLPVPFNGDETNYVAGAQAIGHLEKSANGFRERHRTSKSCRTRGSCLGWA